MSNSYILLSVHIQIEWHVNLIFEINKKKIWDSGGLTICTHALTHGHVPSLTNSKLCLNLVLHAMPCPYPTPLADPISSHGNASIFTFSLKNQGSWFPPHKPLEHILTVQLVPILPYGRLSLSHLVPQKRRQVASKLLLLLPTTELAFVHNSCNEKK